MDTFQPDFSYLLKVLRREPVDRPVLFEFYMNDDVYAAFTDSRGIPPGDNDFRTRVRMIQAFRNAGYDYAVILPGEQYFFPNLGSDHDAGRTYSLNDSSHVDSWDSFESYPWPDSGSGDFTYIERLVPHIPEGMKLIASGPGGVEEILISLTGYENLCFMMHDQSELVDALSEAVGSRLVEYYRGVSELDAVGACISNDDWGFNTQTLLSPQQMDRWIFPWHKRIADTIHASGKPAILHSCGNIYPLFDKITDYLRYDAKHSFEDSILPIERAWEQYHDRIALLGGIDVNFMIMESEQRVYDRSRALLETTSGDGGYALGTGNSVPDYLPIEKYLAMLRAAWDIRSG